MNDKDNPITPFIPGEDEANSEAMFAESGMFDDRTLSVIATVLSAIRAATEGNIAARDRLMQEAVEQYDASRKLH